MGTIDKQRISHRRNRWRTQQLAHVSVERLAPSSSRVVCYILAVAVVIVFGAILGLLTLRYQQTQRIPNSTVAELASDTVQVRIVQRNKGKLRLD